MGSKKISELTTGSLNPPLTAVTPVVYSGETFQQELSTLREVLVDSGSHEFKGDQLFIGDVIVEGSILQKINSPELNEKIGFVHLSGSKVDDTEYNNVNFSFINKNGENIGNIYQNSFALNYFNNDNENYGSLFHINGKNIGFFMRSSIGNSVSRFLIRETESGSTFMTLFADEMRLGCGPQTCSSGITIGNVNASFIKMRSQKNDFEGNTTITGSLNVTGLIYGDGSQLTNLPNSGGTSTILPYLELTNKPLIWDPFVGDPVTFTKEDYGDQVDEIDTNIAITRGDRRGIFNPYFEPAWDRFDNDGVSPLNTLWNNDGWDDLTNVSDRNFYTFFQIFDGSIGDNVRNVELVMKDVTNNKYYKFYFTVWGNSSMGAPVTYTRQQIDGISGENIGDEIEFVKLGYEDPTVVNDPIDTDLTIARGDNQGIYNIALESSWSTDGDGSNSPEGTLWNSSGWGDLTNIKNRTYTTFYESLNSRIGNNIVGTELIMFDTVNNKYHTFKFHSWTKDGDGGGFSYTRQLLNTSDLFVKTNYGDEVDIISDGLHITRGNQGWLYNPLEDGGHGNDTPTNSLWNNDGWDDFSNVTQRTYRTLEDIWGGNFNNIPESEMVMLDTTTDKYWAIKFLTWTPGGNGGGFSYLRYEIDLTQLNEGIKFADNSILKTAKGLGKVKGTFSGNRRIEEITGYSEVSVTQKTYSTETEAIVYQDNNGNFDFYVVDTQELIDLSNDRDSWEAIEFSFDDGQTWREVELSGGFTGVWRQIYFPNSQPEDYVTVTEGQVLLYRVVTGGSPVSWFKGNGDNFRGAIIDFHAYSINSGTIIGTIHIARDSGDYNITHTETKSGSSSIDNVDMWFRTGAGQFSERDILFRRLDGQSDTLKVQWSAKMFYGDEYYD